MKNKYFNDLVEIIVTENLKGDVRIKVPLEFGFLLRIEDVLIFGSSEENKPSWVVESTNYGKLIAGAIRLNQRNIDGDRMTFYASYE